MVHPHYDVHTVHGVSRDLRLIDAEDQTGCDDIDACIEIDGWCGCWTDVEPTVVVPHGTDLPAEALSFLAQPR